MKYIGILIAALLMAMLVGCAQAAEPQNYLNVKDAPFNAKGDGKTDDTAAIQAAIDAACEGENATRQVYLPPGMYMVTKTLLISGLAKRNLKLFGAGGYCYWPQPATTTIVWNGEPGNLMLNISGTGSGIRLADIGLDGDIGNNTDKKAGTLINIEYAKSVAVANVSLERVQMRDAVTGFYCSGKPDLCNSDMTFTDVGFINMTRGFHTAGGQNVNFVFIRPAFNNIDYGMYFEKGGVVACENLGGANVGTAVKIIGTQAGNGNFVFNATKVETQYWKGNRTTILDASSADCEGSVTFNALNVTMAGANEDDVTPLLIVGGKMHVVVQNSILYGRKVATLTGSAAGEPPWITFDDCKFGWGPHPLVSITNDANSGFELRNCMYGNAKIPNYVTAVSQVCPNPPRTMDFSNITATSLTVTWENVTGETGYRLEKCQWVDANKDGKNDAWAWATVSDAIPADTNSYNVTGLTANTKYYFRVRSKNGPSAYALGPYKSVTTLP